MTQTQPINLNSADLPTLRKLRDLFARFKRDGIPAKYHSDPLDADIYCENVSANADFFAQVVAVLEAGQQ